jgi:hypothetical protein
VGREQIYIFTHLVAKETAVKIYGRIFLILQQYCGANNFDAAPAPGKSFGAAPASSPTMQQSIPTCVKRTKIYKMAKYRYLM